MILVVGATGQLGTAVVKLLRAEDRPVRVYVRSEEAARRFEALGCESYVGDLTHPGLAKGPFPRVEIVIATANSAIPTRPGDTVASVDDLGYRNLIAAAVEAGTVRQFLYTSVCDFPHAKRVPLFVAKRRNEQRLMEGGLNYTIFRLPPFMDTAFPMLGATFAVQGTDNATVHRDYRFLRSHFDRIKDSMERDGAIHLPGDGSRRHAYICVDDVARLVAAAVDHPEARQSVLEITGPQAISGEELAQLHERLLKRMLKRKYTPAAVFRLLSIVLKPFRPAAANIMAMNHLAATTDTPVRGQELAASLGVRLTTAEEFLRSRLDRRQQESAAPTASA